MIIIREKKTNSDLKENVALSVNDFITILERFPKYNDVVITSFTFNYNPSVNMAHILIPYDEYYLYALNSNCASFGAGSSRLHIQFASVAKILSSRVGFKFIMKNKDELTVNMHKMTMAKILNQPPLN